MQVLNGVWVDHFFGNNLVNTSVDCKTNISQGNEFLLFNILYSFNLKQYVQCNDATVSTSQF